MAPGLKILREKRVVVQEKRDGSRVKNPEGERNML